MRAPLPGRAERVEEAVDEIVKRGFPEAYVRALMNGYFASVDWGKPFAKCAELRRACEHLTRLIKPFPDGHHIPVEGPDRFWIPMREFRSALGHIAKYTGNPGDARYLAADLAAGLYKKDPKQPAKRWSRYREVTRWFYYAYSGEWADLDRECDAVRKSWRF